MLALGAGTAAQAATVTLVGTDFDVTYDPSQLGPFGVLNLVGDNLFFTTSNFRATSNNGAGVQTDDFTTGAIILTAHNNFQFGSLSLAEFGDYQLQGSASTVSVSGQLRAFDYNNALTTNTAAGITATGPLTTAYNPSAPAPSWSATASIDDSSVGAQIPGLNPNPKPWLANASVVDLSIENLLTAYTADGSGPQQAMIEKKFDGVGVEVSVTPVPLPDTLLMLSAGLGAVLVLGGRGRPVRSLRVPRAA